MAAIGQDYHLYDRLGCLVEGTMFQDGQNRKQTYGYDGFGNLTSTTTTVNGLPTTRNQAVTWSTNRLSGASYDTAGNQLGWGSYTYAWGPQGRLRSHSWFSSQLFYAYGVDGERAMTFDASTGRSTFRIRGLDGKTLREFSHVQGGSWAWEKDWIYRDGQLLGTDSVASAIRHAHNDHLGTPRVFSDVFGNYQERRHLYPFGEQALATGPGPVTMSFTGHERDGNWTAGTTDDLDYMMARYYHPQLGRFTKPDPVGGEPRVPGSFNRYAYVLNDPLNWVDPNGLDEVQVTFYDSVDVTGSLPWYPWGGFGGEIWSIWTRETKIPPKISKASGCQGRVPTTPPDVDLASNIQAAREHKFNLFWLANQVKPEAPWDYKVHGPEFEAFGNWHFGVVASATGVPAYVGVVGAGVVQWRSGTSRLEWMFPMGAPDLHYPSPPFVLPPFGDDPVDSANILLGYMFYEDCVE